MIRVGEENIPSLCNDRGSLPHSRSYHRQVLAHRLLPRQDGPLQLAAAGHERAPQVPYYTPHDVTLALKASAETDVLRLPRLLLDRRHGQLADEERVSIHGPVSALAASRPQLRSLSA